VLSVSMRVQKAVLPTHRTLKHQCGYFLTHPRIFIVRQIYEKCHEYNTDLHNIFIYEKCHEYNTDLHNIFIDFSQAFKTVNRDVIYNSLTKQRPE